MMFLLRWPGMLLMSLAFAYVLFRVFIWALTSSRISNAINRVSDPLIESSETPPASPPFDKRKASESLMQEIRRSRPHNKS